MRGRVFNVKWWDEDIKRLVRILDEVKHKGVLHGMGLEEGLSVRTGVRRKPQSTRW